MSFACGFRIADVHFQSRLVLAPMSGVTNSAFRRLIRELNPGAVGLVVTEFISIEGLTRNNLRSLEMLRFRAEERPISIQIFGYDIARMVDAAQMVEQAGAEIIDINSGCPVPKVVKRGGGCELMRQPEHLKEMLQAVRRAVSIPLTLKIRSGWDQSSRNGVEIARMAEDCGVDMLAVHGRTRHELYRGNADWDFVEEVCRKVSIPVVGSGDITCAANAEAALKRGVAAVMIGRAALTNPWVFSEIAAAEQQRSFENPGAAATVEVLERYHSLLAEDLPERGCLGKLKQLASQITRRVPGSAPVRRDLCSSLSLAEFQTKLAHWRDELERSTDRAWADSSAVASGVDLGRQSETVVW